MKRISPALRKRLRSAAKAFYLASRRYARAFHEVEALVGKREVLRITDAIEEGLK